MSASLVGSEMCIRDSPKREHCILAHGATQAAPSCSAHCSASCVRNLQAVSYTHLTLPTICSV
eukprot:8420243-Alexandrium_andersonii.AAC.1